MPNFFAAIALFGWIPVALLCFRFFRPVTATTIALVGAFTLLPANFAVDPPGLPPIDRHVVGGFAAVLGYFLVVPRSRRSNRFYLWPTLLIGILAFCAFLTALTNSDPLRFGDTGIQGLTPYDALGLMFSRAVTIGVPFYLGSRLIRNHEDVLEILKVIVGFGLLYFPFILWEVRMSPQLHTNLYGYFPHDFLQHIRAGGYRPVVFTGSGLECALFMSTAAISAFALYQAKVKVFGVPPIVSLIVLMIGLMLCKSMGSILYGLCIPALMLASRASVQAKVAVVLSFVILLYPLLRSEDAFPTNAFVAGAEAVSGDRAFSLDFRFKNEDLLLSKAREKYLFGWGSWGRNHVYDVPTGKDLSVTDGYWIIEIGSFGMTGFLSFFSLLLTPLILAARRVPAMPAGLPRNLVTALILILLIRAVDLIPNGFLVPFTLFLAGSLMPFTVRLRRRVRARVQATAEPTALEEAPALAGPRPLRPQA